MEIKVFNKDEHDISEICNISCDQIPYSFEVLSNMLFSKNYICYIIKEKEITGFAIFNFTDTYSADLIYIFIKKDFRNKGFGTKLLTSSLYMLRQRQIREIFIEVKNDNVNAIKLYTNLGFELLSVRKKYYSDNTDALIMICKI